MSISEIKAAIRGVRKAKEKLGAIVARTFPGGADVHWDKGGHRQYGVVLHHGDTGRLRVENSATGKKYWIDMYSVVGYVE